MAIFPGSIAGNTDLLSAANRAYTQLDGGIDDSVTVVPVDDASLFPTEGVITIDNERIKYTSKTGSTFNGCTRGFDGSTPAVHLDDAVVRGNMVAAHHNVLRDEIVAIEGNLFGRVWNVKSYGAAGNGTTDDTTAIQNAITACGTAGGGIVFFPKGTYKVTSSLAISYNKVRLLGVGQPSTINYVQSTPSTCLGFSAGASILSGCSVVNLQIQAVGEATMAKNAIELSDCNDFEIRDFYCSAWTSSGYTTIGILIRGRERIRLHNIHITADKPIYFDHNSNSTIDADHTHISNTYLEAHTGNACITMVSGINVTNLTIDGYNAFIKGKYGLYFPDTATTLAGVNWTIRGIRWEQNTDGAGYLIYISHNYALMNLIIEGIYGGWTGNGVYLRKMRGVAIRNVFYLGSGTSLNVDSTVLYTMLHNYYDGSGSRSTTGWTHWTEMMFPYATAQYVFKTGGCPFSGLGTPPDGTLAYCTDADPVTAGAGPVATTSTGAKTGAMVARVNGAWRSFA